MIAWSYGGGVQSVAIGVLVAEGALPVPDLAVIADTGRERRTTWEYLHDHMQPYLLNRVGLTVQTASHDLARKDLYDDSGLTLMPAYTAEGRKAAFCSGEWKRDVIERWLRAQGVRECVSWIGYSIDEVRRVPKRDHRPWCHLAFPLIDRMINRTMCAAIIRAAGLPLPRKSRCRQCPHQNAEEWAETLADPVDGPLAVACDEEIRRNDPEGRGLYLHYSRKPLSVVASDGGDGLVPPMSPCEAGHCWT